MTEILMVRHGESEHNRKGIIQGQIDSELTGEGRRQAEKLGEFLSGKEFDRIYSSDLRRAVETAKIALEEGFRESEKLRERDYGELEGESFDVWKDMDPDDHHGWSAEEAESLKEHKERVMEVLEKTVEEGLDNVLIVAHGGTIAAAIMDILNCESRQAWRFSIDSCSVTRIRYTGEGWMIDEVNSTCHL